MADVEMTQPAHVGAADALAERRLRALVRSWGVSRFSERVAVQWLQQSLAADDGGGDDLRRLRAWVLLQLNGQWRAADCSVWQAGCPEVVPLLRAASVWDRRAFPWVRALEDNFAVIKAELLALRGQAAFQPYRAPTWAGTINAADGLGSAGHDAGDWRVFYLFLHNVDFSANRRLCPRTTAVLESIDSQYDHAFFSALAPHTHVAKHHGPTNKKLRCHLPLVVPPAMADGVASCRLRVGDDTIDVREGECFVFDDSFEHEAWNDDPQQSRVVLIVDVWHPELSAAERKFLNFLRNAQLRSDKQRCEATGDADNFFSIIQQANKSTRDEEEGLQQQAAWS